MKKMKKMKNNFGKQNYLEVLIKDEKMKKKKK